jgi:hypothetical protein
MSMMSEGHGTRDPSSAVPVEGVDASGAASSFDGNHTSDAETWLFGNENWNDDSFRENTLLKLMYFTSLGHLSWVVFPRQGFRL